MSRTCLYYGTEGVVLIYLVIFLQVNPWIWIHVIVALSFLLCLPCPRVSAATTASRLAAIRFATSSSCAVAGAALPSPRPPSPCVHQRPEEELGPHRWIFSVRFRATTPSPILAISHFPDFFIALPLHFLGATPPRLELDLWGFSTEYDDFDLTLSLKPNSVSGARIFHPCWIP